MPIATSCADSGVFEDLGVGLLVVRGVEEVFMVEDWVVEGVEGD